jgi:hypothetical protein
LYRMGTPLARPCSSLRLLPGRNTCAPWCSYVSSCRQDTTGAGAKINTFHTYFLSGAAMRPDFWSRCCLNMPDIGRDCQEHVFMAAAGVQAMFCTLQQAQMHTHMCISLTGLCWFYFRMITLNTCTPLSPTPLTRSQCFMDSARI